jgi:hypothetical protein
MDDKTPVETTITVSSNPEDNIDEILSKDDEQSWKPDDSDETPEITVTVTEEEEPITDVIVNGEFEEFVVTVLDKDDNSVVEVKVCFWYFFQAILANLSLNDKMPFLAMHKVCS